MPKNDSGIKNQITAESPLLASYSYEQLMAWREQVTKLVLKKINTPDNERAEAKVVFSSTLSGQPFSLVLSSNKNIAHASSLGVYTPSKHCVNLYFENAIPGSPHFEEHLSVALDHEIHHAYEAVVNSKLNINLGEELSIPYAFDKKEEEEIFKKTLRAGMKRINKFQKLLETSEEWLGMFKMSYKERDQLTQWKKAIAEHYKPELKRYWPEEKIDSLDGLYLRDTLTGNANEIFAKYDSGSVTVIEYYSGTVENKELHFILDMQRFLNEVHSENSEDKDFANTEIDAHLHEIGHLREVFFPELEQFHLRRHAQAQLPLHSLPNKNQHAESSSASQMPMYSSWNANPQSALPGSAPLALSNGNDTNLAIPLALFIAVGTIGFALWMWLDTNKKDENKNKAKLK